MGLWEKLLVDTAQGLGSQVCPRGLVAEQWLQEAEEGHLPAFNNRSLQVPYLMVTGPLRSWVFRVSFWLGISEGVLVRYDNPWKENLDQARKGRGRWECDLVWRRVMPVSWIQSFWGRPVQVSRKIIKSEGRHLGETLPLPWYWKMAQSSS